MSYFKRTGFNTFLPTPHTGGAWDVDDQHIAPALGLLLHEIELHRDRRRDDGLEPARLSYDILGTVPLEEFEVQIDVLRPGRTVELVQASLIHGGRAAVLLRAWLMSGHHTSGLEGNVFPPMPGPAAMEEWDPTSVWPGGFIESARVKRQQEAPGRARYWVTTPVKILEEPVSPTATAAGLFDIANGMTVRVSPEEVAFPNLDLTAHLFRGPNPGWLGFDTTVAFGPDGIGLTHSVIHDSEGPFGTIGQSLTVRPS